MINLFRRVPKNKLILALDVGTSSVSGILFFSRPDQPPAVIKTLKAEMPLVPEKDFHALWRKTQSAIKNLLADIKKYAPHKINLVSVVLSSPWYISQTRISRIKRDLPFEITKSLVDLIIEDEMKRFQNETKNDFPKNIQEAVMPLEKNIMKILLNGYGAANFFNKNVKEIELYVYASVVMKSIHESLFSLINNELGRADLILRTNPFVVFDTLRRILNTEEGFLFINIGGEITDLSLIRSDFLEITASFPRGSHAIIRKTAGVLHLPLEETASLLRLHGDEKLAAPMKQKLSKALFLAIKDWYGFFVEVLSNFGGVRLLPQYIFLVGELSGLEEFSQFMAREDTARFNFLGKPFTIQRFLSASLEDRFHFKKSFKNGDSTSLMLSSLFIDNYVWQKK